MRLLFLFQRREEGRVRVVGADDNCDILQTRTFLHIQAIHLADSHSKDNSTNGETNQLWDRHERDWMVRMI